ncbi:hypothetical protein [Streptomyces litchfieldiae]|uniref:Secreted protein n=1 Tax=Streptomyces litchfieldiae TaxID=3075543 RepID=A0ABU2MJ76_9ACTN|nr:hypothetical protein [Streptomyces sp. DSM 44938]MDT0341651.1 hypothetical protein [Streptomyces sp. DSM 44938]
MAERPRFLHGLLRGLLSLGVMAIGYAPREWWDKPGEEWWERPDLPQPAAGTESRAGAESPALTFRRVPAVHQEFVPSWHPER